MKIVTGYRGTQHITSNDVQGQNQGFFGSGNYVLNVGHRLEGTLDGTVLSIKDGEGMMQGVHFRVLPGTVDTVTIDNGVTGYQRIDLVCARYTKTELTGVENVEWVVITGTPAAADPAVPTYYSGDVLGGDAPVDFPMFQITWNGVTPTLSTIWTDDRITVYQWDENITMVEPSVSTAITLNIGKGVHLVSYFIIGARCAATLSDGYRDLPLAYDDVGTALVNSSDGTLTVTFNTTDSAYSTYKYRLRIWGMAL